MKLKLIALTFSTASLLTACGGGGGDSPSATNTSTNTTATTTTVSPSAAPSAQGFWNDSSSYNVITPNGEFWGINAIEQTVSGATKVLWALDQGRVSVTSSNVSGSATEYIPNGSATTSIIFSGTLVERSTLSGSGTVGSDSMNFKFTYDSRYDNVATVSQIAGTWTAKALDGALSATDTVVIASSGTYTQTLHSSSGATCVMSGTVAPDTSGKNFFRLQAKFGTGNCTFPNQSVSGVAFLTSAGYLVIGSRFSNEALAALYAKA